MLPPSADDIEAAKQRLFASEQFANAGRLRTLFDYLLDREGAGAPAKGYEIGVDVFGREPDFDPAHDAIVRVSVGRLRMRLEHYFSTAGADETHHFRIPKGSYRLRYEAVEKQADRPKTLDRPQATAPRVGIAIPPFIVAAELETLANAEAARQTFCIELSRSKALGDVTLVPKCDSTIQEIAEKNGVRFVLTGRISLVGEFSQLSLAFLEGSTGAAIWGEEFRGDATDIAARWTEVTLSIAGVIRSMCEEAIRRDLKESIPAVSRTAYQAGLVAAWTPRDLSSSEAAMLADRDQLHQALKDDPSCGLAHSVLASKIAYLAMFSPIYATERELKRAAHHAQQALVFASDDSLALLNLVICYWHLGDRLRLSAITRRALSLDPNHPFLSTLTIVLPYMGNVAPADVVARLQEQQTRLHPRHPGHWVVLNALGRLALARGDFAEAKALSLQAYFVSNVPSTGLRLAIAALKLSERELARDVLDELFERWPGIDLDYFASTAIPRQFMGGAAGPAMSACYHELVDFRCKPLPAPTA